ncbi:methionyl-tRNA formyltransferase, mitochondrial [Chrysoperla carnea]|uniref:methionyl-tRNA formyltransferase, mitochondrial n=1 Tax=Chrysoperla carnea TaxID=189513 RepID=UPI001D089FC9|nr:methionyl-tRNA formyltransferase, mitochondrial [Chrysoperla carnea]
MLMNYKSHIKHFLKITKYYKKWIRQHSSQTNLNLKPPWKVMFFGTDEFSVCSLDKLYSTCREGSVINQLEVVTSVKNKANPVQRYAVSNKIQFHNWPCGNVDQKFDIGVVVSFGKLIPKSIIHEFPLGMINVHASLLPRWRGAAPIIHALASGDEVTGVTIMRIQPHKFDLGEIIKQKSIEITDNTTQDQLTKELANIGASLLVDTIKELPTCIKNATPQPENGVTYAPRINIQSSRINWLMMDSNTIYNLYRALKGLYHLHCTWKGIPVKFIDVGRLNTESSSQFTNNPSSQISNIPGYVYYSKNHNHLRIQCKDGKWIVVNELIVHGRKPMKSKDFYNGFMSKCHPKLHMFT